MRFEDRFSLESAMKPGNTPLLEVTRAAPGPGRIWVKCEHLNPRGSLFDRVAADIIRSLPEGPVHMASTGGLAIAVAHLLHAEGRPLNVSIPRSSSPERVAELEHLGAKVTVVDSDYLEEATVCANTDPMAKGKAFDPLGEPLIVRGLEAIVDEVVDAPAFGDVPFGKGPNDRITCAIGTWSTFNALHLAGFRRGTKAVGVYSRTYGTLIQGMAVFETHKGPAGSLEEAESGNANPHIGVQDSEAFEAAERLAQLEGLLVGPSAGAAFWGALQLSAFLGPTSRIVAVLPDSGERSLLAMAQHRARAK